MNIPCDPAWDVAMQAALDCARQAQTWGDVPIGAVVLDAAGVVVGKGMNVRERDGDPAGHAEIVAMREAASALGSWNLSGCTLVVTLEPCVMCAGAISQCRVTRLVFGAWDAKAGACGSVYDVVRDPALPHFVEVLAPLREAECAGLIRDFFAERR